ncbi:hypothetical protein SAMN04487788_2749 [Microbacterium testaceum StLB037]|uniref:Uncharacterized protein n=1 Tax=Microbacterium testaceum (strain StLB037) TaxID=979556 RepID=A0A1H0R936_MICTS|nr:MULTISPECIES: hypothetical protein [Microbacterium]KQM39921.1 hypothetical protein ASE56_05875 [Microbacterium sp. Leaf203]SDP25950.1 hypothetical protein SAMN04487788_2749 [Microbacterium testaceum StLB037]
MIVLALLASIAAAGVALTMLFLAHGRPDDDRGGERADMVRYFGMSAIAALVCGAMNVMETAWDSVAAAAAGNATNIVAVGLLWAGARRLNGRRAIGAVSTGAGGILLFGLTFLVPLDDATLLKTAGLVVFSALCALECARPPVGQLGGARLLSWTLSLYAAYNLARLTVAAAFGMGPLLRPGPVSAETTAAVSAVAIALVSVGAVWVGRQLDDDPAPGTRAFARGALRRETSRLLSEHAIIRATLVRVPEIDLIRAAHSGERGETMLRTVADAAMDAVPGAVTGMPARDTVFVVAPAATDAAGVEESLRNAFARRMPSIDYDDVPDLAFEHHLLRDVDDLSWLMESRRSRPRRTQSGSD